MSDMKDVVIKKDEDVRLTTEYFNQRTCIYVHLNSNGLLTLSGGSGIIDWIEGKGMLQKVLNGPYYEGPTTLDVMDLLNNLIEFRKKEAKLYDVQTAWENEGKYIMKLHESLLDILDDGKNKII